MSDYFGQSPDGYQKPLYAASNFSDVVDKPAARTTLGAASKDDVLKAANPIGTIIAFYGSVAPYGYLPCSGQTVSSSTFPSLVTFLGGTTSATLPDLRGEFLRGWDNGRGVDPGRTIASYQKGSVHSFDTGAGIGIVSDRSNALPATGINVRSDLGYDAGLVTDYPSGQSVSSSGGTWGWLTDAADINFGVTRPRNVSVLYCIKAYDTPVNAGTLNIGSIASEVALKTALSDFTGTNQSFAANGWQKLPGGMIIQWGKSAGVAGNNVITFPIAFPNACVFTMASVDAELSSVSDTSRTIITNGKTTTTATFYGGQTESNGAAAGPFNWLATGY